MGRALKYLAGARAGTGLLAAVIGALRSGALAFASAVALFGTGVLLEGVEESATALVILLVGILSVLGVVGYLLAGLEALLSRASKSVSPSAVTQDQGIFQSSNLLVER